MASAVEEVRDLVADKLAAVGEDGPTASQACPLSLLVCWLAVVWADGNYGSALPAFDSGETRVAWRVRFRIFLPRSLQDDFDLCFRHRFHQFSQHLVLGLNLLQELDSLLYDVMVRAALVREGRSAILEELFLPTLDLVLTRISNAALATGSDLRPVGNAELKLPFRSVSNGLVCL